MTPCPHELLIKRLDRVTGLSEDDRETLRAMPVSVQDVDPGRDIVREGERVNRCCILIDGFTQRYRTTRDGKRQIIAFHVPGDIPDLHSLHINLMDHSFAPTIRSTIAFVDHKVVWSLCTERPGILAALWRETLIDGATFREWIVGLGRRDGRGRTAHLLCELAIRLRSVGLAPNHIYHLPLTQNDLADALGLTVVTVNRILKEFKSEGLLERERSRLVLKDGARLAEIGEFDPTYLHLREGVELNDAATA